MRLKFTKMHGCGNDYIYINCFNNNIKNPEKLSITLSDRHFGIGGDGLILVCPSQIADAKMRMFNLDGSEGKMCGNGIRCIGKYLFDNNIVDNHKNSVSIETLSGVKHLMVFKENNIVTKLRVDMGKPIFEPKLIPANINGEKIINQPLILGNATYYINCISMGNPHCVVFCDDIMNINIEDIGPLFEKNLLFPEGINTEFAKIISKNMIEMRVWERGSGETLACGTGACAVAVAAIENGYCKKGEDITIKLKGGELTINYEESVFMTGNAQKVFEGEIEI